MTLPLKLIAAPVAVALLLTACGSDGGAPSVETIEAAPAIAHLTVDVRNPVEHDSNAFTEGLVFADGALYESTGKYGRSELRQVAINSGEVLRSTPLDANLFGEGLAHVDDRLIQLTWKSGRALVYDRASLSVIEELAYEGEGWGLCFDGDRLVMSDGSSTLTFRDPESFDVLGTIDVSQAGSSVTLLNELECVDGSVYANVWRTDRIVRIDPSTGQVEAEIDAASLERSPTAGVLNGIAYDPTTGLFRLTGKFWSSAYDVEFVERE